MLQTKTSLSATLGISEKSRETLQKKLQLIADIVEARVQFTLQSRFVRFFGNIERVPQGTCGERLK